MILGCMKIDQNVTCSVLACAGGASAARGARAQYGAGHTYPAAMHEQREADALSPWAPTNEAMCVSAICSSSRGEDAGEASQRA